MASGLRRGVAVVFVAWRVAGFAEVRELGAGGQGRAVLVREEASGRVAVLKYVLSDDPRALDRFRRESALLKNVSSPYVARWFGHYEDTAGAAILMEAIDGVSLQEILAVRGALAPESALTVLLGSLTGLACAHKAGIVHRDYKPANVMVRADGLSKLVDFGIAALRDEAAGASGTPAYMAPEQWAGAAATPATDVYAATCVFFEAVTGRRPFAGTSAELRMRHLSAPVPVDEVPAPLRDLVARGLAKDPGTRPSDAAAFATELEIAATAAYGPDWADRGVAGLATAAASLAAVFPLTGLAMGAGKTGLLATTAGKTLVIGTALTIGAAGAGAYVATRPSDAHHLVRPQDRAATAVQAAMVEKRFGSFSVAARHAGGEGYFTGTGTLDVAANGTTRATTRVAYDGGEGHPFWPPDTVVIGDRVYLTPAKVPGAAPSPRTTVDGASAQDLLSSTGQALQARWLASPRHLSDLLTDSGSFTATDSGTRLTYRGTALLTALATDREGAFFYRPYAKAPPGTSATYTLVTDHDHVPIKLLLDIPFHVPALVAPYNTDYPTDPYEIDYSAWGHGHPITPR